ncbi:hypothetical protein M413DRAFT_30377 [Hebeloma cylindrosporum]|uniref:F-box domain-containing protein n=1 Tax=Hebeloma cylindrosporum TaxID=76867 RepID=A0A0C3BNM6_HEBCY|nr:hypothetical protein M413DRAFT_30377 [Hebeloma cylindrosporum h7]
MNENHDQLIDKLPPEIVSQIFIQYSLPNSCSDITDLNSPLNLGAVCQKWRQLAWATPEIWSSLWFGFGSGRQRIGRLDLVPLVGEWLERSAGLPLTIKCAPGGEPADEIYCRLIAILNKYSTRWYDMDIAIPKRHRGLLCGSSEEQNILDRLTLRPHWRTDELQAHPSTDKSSTFRVKSKPSPTHFTLVSHSFAYIDISCNRLTHASVEDVHVDECCELIQCAPLLEVLKLRDIHGSHSRRRPRIPIPNSRVVLRHLHSLELNGNTKDKVLVRILDSISTPSLKHWIHRTYGGSSPNMISFIEHSAFSLKTFQVAGPRDVYDEVHLVLSHLSSLESLRLHIYSGFHEPDGPPLADEFLDLLCSPGETSVFLPHLQSLQFTGSLHSHGIRFLEYSRHHSGVP